MSTTSRVAGAVAAGYVLGRFKKLRLAVLVGSAMASPKFRNAASGMIQDRIPGGAITTTLSKEVGGRLLNIGKTAATSIVASRIDSLSQNLADRSQNLRSGRPGKQADKSRGEEEEGDESQEPEDEYDDTQEPEDEYEEEGDDTQEPEDEYDDTQEPEDEYEEEDVDETQEPEDEYEEEEADDTQEPEDEYEEEDADETQEPEDEYEEEEGDGTQEQDARASDDGSADEESADEEPEEPVTRSPRRRRSASPAGRRRG